MLASDRLAYWQRVVAAYVLPGRSQLTFWHEVPAVNERATYDALGEYYMTFADKADYPGPFDDQGIPLLDYRGAVGRQYNPIAIAQYGLANYNVLARAQSSDRRKQTVAVADWLVANLESNGAGLPVWNHHFDWEYRTTLKAPWYSALAQGQGISMLVRAHALTGEARYLEVAGRAFLPLLSGIGEGGVSYVDEQDQTWLEEYIVDPPTHILNGFIWATWGVWDYYLATGDSAAKDLFERSIDTIKANLHRYDAGYWSLYEQSGTRLAMLASPFYHALHVVQLDVLYRLTGEDTFARYADKWRAYRESRLRRMRAMVHKVVFKIWYY